MYSYLAFALGIHSALPLPELVSAEAGYDVIITYAYGKPDRPPNDNRPWYITMTDEKAVYHLDGVGTFLVQGGQKISIFPAAGISEDLLRLYILGNVMGLLLYQRGLLVLHASAVRVGDEAIAFLGAPGWGKSSLAAAFYAQEFGVVSDDLSPLRVTPQATTLFPAFPRLKLDEEVALALGFEPEALVLLHPQEEKRGLFIHHGFSTDPLPLRCAYVLGSGPVPTIEPLCPREVVIELLRHSFPTRLLQPGTATHLQQCTDLARQTPFFRLRRPPTLAQLPALVGLIKSHQAGL